MLFRSVGAVAGHLTGAGYLSIMVQGKSYYAHRIAWALTHGSWPEGDIDHLDGVRSNNRLVNLRDVSNATNIQNQKRAHRDNRSGSKVQGVCWREDRGMFRVKAVRYGKTIHVGYFATIDEAEAASIAYRRDHYAGFTL